jgi:hypothetical protein
VLNPELTDVVWNVLEAWSEPDVSLQLQMTAAAALGAPVGATDYSRALEILGTQAKADSYRLIQAVCQSVTDLFGAVPSGAAGGVIAALTRWSDGRDTRRVNTALAALLQIALDLDWARPNGELWPALVCVTDADVRWRDDVAALWRRTLHHTAFDAAAVAALRRYVQAAHRAPAMREPLSDLILAMAGSSRDEATLRYHLAIAAREEKESADTADMLIDRLRRMR